MSEPGRPNRLPSSCKDAGERCLLSPSGERSSLQRLKAVRVRRHTPMTLLNHGASPGGMPCTMRQKQPGPEGPVEPRTKQSISLTDCMMARVYHKVLKIANEWCGAPLVTTSLQTCANRASVHPPFTEYKRLRQLRQVCFRTRRSTSGASVMIPSAPSNTKRRISSG